MMNTPLRLAGATARTLRCRRRRPLAWLAVTAVIVLLAACSQETVRDQKVTPAPTSAEAAVAATEQVPEKVEDPTATTEAPAKDAKDTEAAPSEPSGDAGLEISVPGDGLDFDKSTLSAAAGSEVVIVFKNASSVLQHNWVLVKGGAKDEVATAGLPAGPGNDYVPPGDERVIAQSKLLDAGASEEIRFTAPAAGTYQFVCTFPGHNSLMFGDFEVK